MFDPNPYIPVKKYTKSVSVAAFSKVQRMNVMYACDLAATSRRVYTDVGDVTRHAASWTGQLFSKLHKITNTSNYVYLIAFEK